MASTVDERATNALTRTLELIPPVARLPALMVILGSALTAYYLFTHSP